MKYYADMHCDTATELFTKNEGLLENSLHISLEKAKQAENYCQVFAFWTPDDLKGEERYQNFINVYNNFIIEVNKYSEKIIICNNFTEINSAIDNKKTAAILAVEGAGIIGDNLERIAQLKKMGIRFITLTWNATNELGDGILVEKPAGLTEFGKKAIQKMEEENIIVDVSHLSEVGFWQICEIANKPFVATHSNAKAICSHVRNLTNEQALAIKGANGLVGINLCPAFLNNEEEKADIKDIIKHIEHYLSLNLHNNICFGADFDGISSLPIGINNISNIEKIQNEMSILNYSDELIEKIFYDNFMNFCKENLL